MDQLVSSGSLGVWVVSVLASLEVCAVLSSLGGIGNMLGGQGNGGIAWYDVWSMW
jgi:hypothetical protein